MTHTNLILTCLNEHYTLERCQAHTHISMITPNYQQTAMEGVWKYMMIFMDVWEQSARAVPEFEVVPER